MATKRISQGLPTPEQQPHLMELCARYDALIQQYRGRKPYTTDNRFAQIAKDIEAVLLEAVQCNALGAAERLLNIYAAGKAVAPDTHSFLQSLLWDEQRIYELESTERAVEFAKSLGGERNEFAAKYLAQYYLVHNAPALDELTEDGEHASACLSLDSCFIRASQIHNNNATSSASESLKALRYLEPVLKPKSLTNSVSEVRAIHLVADIAGKHGILSEAFVDPASRKPEPGQTPKSAAHAAVYRVLAYHRELGTV